MTPVLAAASAVLASVSSSSSSTPLFLLAAGPAAAGGVYWLIYRFYRNTDKTHQFESETRVDAQPVRGSDHRIRTIRATTESSISGANAKRHRARVTRG